MPERVENKKITLAVSIGDPMGIGAEITAKALKKISKEIDDETLNFIVLGDITQFQQSARRYDLALDNPCFSFVNTGSYPEVKAGQVAYQAIEQSIQLIADNKADALVTGPISKERLWAAGLPDSGHTEILERLSENYFPQSHPAQADMLFVHHGFRLLLLTRHTPLSEVSKVMTKEKVVKSIDNMIVALKAQGIERPMLAVLGVNPHAGEIGGQEEAFILQPAIDEINQKYGLTIESPKAADAFFRGFDPNQPKYDAVVASYHDQGLVPMKLLAGLAAVNVTIGLPFIRTSVSHGTADDIVGKGIASSESMVSAITEAKKLVLTTHTLSFNNNCFSV